MLAFGARPFLVFASRRLAFRLGEHRRGHRLAQVDARIELLTDLAVHAHLHGLDPGHLCQREHELREPRRQALGARARGELRTEVDRGDTVLDGQALDPHASRQLRADALLRFRGGRAGEQLLDRGLDAAAAAARDDGLLALQEGDVDAHDPPILPARPALTSSPAASPRRVVSSASPARDAPAANAPRTRRSGGLSSPRLFSTTRACTPFPTPKPKVLRPRMKAVGCESTHAWAAAATLPVPSAGVCQLGKHGAQGPPVFGAQTGARDDNSLQNRTCSCRSRKPLSVIGGSRVQSLPLCSTERPRG